MGARPPWRLWLAPRDLSRPRQAELGELATESGAVITTLVDSCMEHAREGVALKMEVCFSHVYVPWGLLGASSGEGSARPKESSHQHM